MHPTISPDPMIQAIQHCKYQEMPSLPLRCAVNHTQNPIASQVDELRVLQLSPCLIVSATIGDGEKYQATAHHVLRTRSAHACSRAETLQAAEKHVT